MARGKTGYVQTDQTIESWHVNETKMVWLTAAATPTSGDVLVLASAADEQADTTTTRASQKPVAISAFRNIAGVATEQTQPSGTPSWFQAWGKCPGVNLISSAARGDWLITSETAGLGEPITSTDPPLGAFAFALTEGCTPVAFLLSGGGGAGQVEAREYRPPLLLTEEYTYLAPSGTASLSHSGAGEIESIWLAMECAASPSDWDACWKHPLEITVDGVKRVDTIVGNFFASTYGAPRWGVDRIGCSRMAMERGISSFYRFVNIPFEDSIEVGIQNISNVSATLWAQVALRDGTGVYPRRDRNFRCETLTAGSVLEHTATVLINATPAVPGRIEGFMLALAGNTSWSFLEGNVEIEVDGAKVIEYTGTEDAFGGSFYYTDVKWQTNHFGLTKQHTRTDSSPYYRCCFYRFFDKDPIPFEESLKITWYNGEVGRGNPGDVEVYHEVWYYLS